MSQKFSVGDKVRSRYSGEEGVVARLVYRPSRGDYLYRVRTDNSLTSWWEPEELELATEPENNYPKLGDCTCAKCWPLYTTVPDPRAKLLDEAKKIVTSDRNKDYGDPEDNFRNIANLWMDYLRGRLSDDLLEPYDVAAMMILMKVARLMETPGNEDSWKDIAGYSACGWSTVKKAA